MGTKKISSSDILFSQARQRLLGILYSQPDVDFYTNEIIRLTNTGTGAIQRELKKLTDAGLITIKAVGNQKRYSANKALPFFAELRSIILKTFGLADIIRKELVALKQHINSAFIFGSIAKQEDTAHSDIDLMLIGEDLTYGEVFRVLEKVEIQLGRKVNPTFYSTQEWIRKHKAGNNFIQQIIQQPKIFLIGTEDEFIQLK